MAKHPTDDNAKLPESEAEARFKRLVGNLVNTPHKPHKPADAANDGPGGKKANAR
jgi:hypothetical protein